MPSEGENSTLELPLFPLQTVLFPGQALPLHIFEDRYKQMIQRCLEEGSAFGVLLVKEGREVGDPTAIPYEIGTAARITQVEHLRDGRMNIMTVGMRRFRVREFYRDRSYLVGNVEPYPLQGKHNARAEELSREMRPRIANYVRLLEDIAGLKLGLETLPEDSTMLAYLTAIALQVSNHEKQRLLSVVSLPRLLSLEARMLEREEKLLKYMLDTQGALDAITEGPTGQLFPN